MRERGGREGGREGKEGGRGREEGVGREGDREGGREGEREGGREGGRLRYQVDNAGMARIRVEDRRRTSSEMDLICIATMKINVLT